jgi:Flp pilus assembly protein TadG
VVLTAILRIGARAGFNVGSPELDFSSGAEVGVWANIAEFITNVTAGTGSCEILVEEVYSMAIGAQAGATLAIADHTWGPTPNTSTVVFYTTLASVCAGNNTAATSSGAALTARAAAATGLTSTSLTTTTLSTKVTYTGIACLSTGLVNCPVSLQTTSKYTTTKTLITSVPSGSKATFPATTVNSVANTIAFGTNVKALESSSGIPTSYVPTATASSKIEGILDGKTGGVSNKIIIGVSVGGGLLVLLAVSGGCV